MDLAYTQTIFWRLRDPSGPLNPTTYSPEVFVGLPIGHDLITGAGYRHDSNGDGPATSIDSNRLFGRATRSFDLAEGWRGEVMPIACVYVAQWGIAPICNAIGPILRSVWP